MPAWALIRSDTLRYAELSPQLSPRLTPGERADENNCGTPMTSPPPLTSLLEHQQRLHVDCCRCGRKLEFAPEEAISAFGAAMTIPRLARILRCTECGARGRDHEISVYPNSNDYYASLERQRYAQDVEKLGQAEADLSRAYRLRNTGELHKPRS